MALPPIVRNIWDTVSTPGVNFSAGTLASVRSDIFFSNSNNVSFGLQANGVITAIAAGGTGGAGGAAIQGSGVFSQNTGTIQFQNSNGITFGLTAGQMTASVQTNYQSAGAYLTTAALSADSSKYAGTNGAITGGSITVNTGGVSVNLPAYLTTAALSQDSSKYAGTTAGITGGSLTVNTAGVAINLPPILEYAPTFFQYVFNSSNNVGVDPGAGFVAFDDSPQNASIMVISDTDADGLNRSDLFNHWASDITALKTKGTLVFTKKSSPTVFFVVTVTGTGTHVGFSYYSFVVTGQRASGTINNGDDLIVSFYYGDWDGTLHAGTSAGITGGSLTVNTAGIHINLPSYLTTAALSGDTSKYAGINGAITGGSITVNTSGVSINLPAYLTTAAQSGDTSNYAGVGESTGTIAGSTLGLTVNTAGVSIAYPNWLTTAQSAGAYLTTAALSQDSSKYAGINGAITGGSITVNTSGVSVNLPAYLTTAALSGDTSKYVQAWDILGANTAGTTSSAQGTKLHFSAANGLTFSGSSNTIILSVGVYLTTAALSADSSKYAGISTGMTGGSVTLNTSGIAISLPAYLTTAALSGDTSKYAGINGSVATTAGTDLALTLNTSGATIGYPRWITTYVNDLTSQRAGTNTSVATTAGTDITLGVNTSGVTIGYPKWITTYVNDLTSGRAGTGFTTATTAGTVIVGTLNTAGLSMGVPAYLTAASVAGAGCAISNSQTLFSTGTVAISEGGGAITIASSAGGQSLMFSVPQTSSLVGVNGITISVSGSTISVSAGNYLTTAALSGDTSKYAGTGFTTATTAGTAIVGTHNTAGLSMGVPAYMTNSPLSYWSNMDVVQGTSSFSLQSNSVNVQPFNIQMPISASYLRIPVSFANLTSTTLAVTAGSTSFYYYQSINAVIYSQGVGANSRSLQYVASSYAAFTEAIFFSISNAGTNESIAYAITYPIEGGNTSNTASTMLTTAAGASIFLHTTGVMTNFTGIHWLDIPLATLFNPGNYWVAFNRSTSSTTSGGGIAITGNINRAHTLVAATQINANYVPLGFNSGGGATASTQPVWQVGLGSHSVSAQGATTSSLALSSISSVANFPIIPMQLIRQA